MAELRYMGSGTWSRVTTDKDGKFTGYDTVNPGETIEVPDEWAKNVLASPRYLRSFVEVGSSEDPHSKDYEPSRHDAVAGNAVAYPELEMGSTVTGGQAIFVTEDDNPGNLPYTNNPAIGPQSDNREAVVHAEAEAAADKARTETRQKLTAKPAQRSESRPAHQKSEG